MYANYAALWSRIARRRPEMIAVSAPGESLNYGEFEQAARAAASALSAQKVESGDRVAFCLHNTIEYLVLLYACLKLEAVPVSINYRYRGSEMAELLKVAKPAVLVHAHSTRPSVQDAVALVVGTEAAPRVLIEIDSPQAQAQLPPGPAVEAEGMLSLAYRDLMAVEPTQLPDPSVDAQMYVFTGGTTGVPKAVVWGIGDLLHIQQSSIYGPLGLEPPRDLSAAVDLAAGQDRRPVRTLPLAPFIHATALFSAMNTLALGGTVVINPNPRMVPADVVRLIIEERVTRLIVAGDAVAMPILDVLEADGAQGRTSLTSVISSGMRFSDDTKRRIHGLGKIAIVDILASTEGGPYAMAVTTDAEGLPAKFQLTEDAVVLDDSQREVQHLPGATGVLAYRGALPKGYLDDPEKTSQTYPVIRGVRHCSPGDYVRVGEGGHIELLGRGSNVVNTGGEKVFPGEVEEVLLSHPAVTDAAVFGVPDPRWGQRVAAVVAVEPGSPVTEEELLEHVGARLAGYKKPRTLAVRESLGRGPTGKLNMRRVRESLSPETTQAASSS